MDRPVWEGPRPHFQPCPHVHDAAERVILIEPVLGLDMCCRCGAVFGPHHDLWGPFTDAMATDYPRILATYVERESRDAKPPQLFPLYMRSLP